MLSAVAALALDAPDLGICRVRPYVSVHHDLCVSTLIRRALAHLQRQTTPHVSCRREQHQQTASATSEHLAPYHRHTKPVANLSTPLPIPPHPLGLEHSDRSHATPSPRASEPPQHPATSRHPHSLQLQYEPVWLTTSPPPSRGAVCRYASGRSRGIPAIGPACCELHDHFGPP